jgi:hypothetical protein
MDEGFTFNCHHFPDEPYVILSACPCYNQPSIHKEFGVIEAENANSHFITHAVMYMLKHKSIEFFQEESDVVDFFNNYNYRNYNMGNSPWEVWVYQVNYKRWVNATPSNNVIWKQIKMMKDKWNDIKDDVCNAINEMN